MLEEKRRRLAVAGTVTAVLLLFILAVVLVYQLASIGSMKRQERKLLEEKQRLEQQIEDINDEIERRSTEWAVELEARKHELVYPGDKKVVVE